MWQPTPRSADGGVDEVPVPGLGGRLWLCGKHAVGPDPEAALAAVGATRLVCLTEEHELADRYPHYVRWLHANAGERAVWFPIPDLHAPHVQVVRPFVESLVADLRHGEGLLMHCAAGIGRAGTMAVCILMTAGLTRDVALAAVAAHRPMAGPEVGAQRELVAGWTSPPSTPRATTPTAQ